MSFDEGKKMETVYYIYKFEDGTILTLVNNGLSIGNRDWKMSFFFTHYNESDGTCCLNSIMDNHHTYISDGKTRNDIQRRIAYETEGREKDM